MADPKQSPKPDTTDRDIAIAATTLLFRRERQTARALLRAEAKTLRRMRTSVRRASDSLVAAVVPVAKEAAATYAQARIRNTQAVLQGDLHRDIVHSSKDARAAGRTGLEREFGPDHAIDHSGDVEDDTSAHASGSSLASAWAQTALAIVASWPGGPEAKPLSTELSQLKTLTDGRVRRTAATETARAFNDERSSVIDRAGVRNAAPPRGVAANSNAGDPSAEDVEPVLPENGLFKVWSAILDGRTCAYCRGADGQTVAAGKPFIEGDPPAHPLCRCIVDYLIVREQSRIRDQKAFLREVRDIIHARRDQEIADEAEAAREREKEDRAARAARRDREEARRGAAEARAQQEAERRQELARARRLEAERVQAERAAAEKLAAEKAAADIAAAEKLAVEEAAAEKAAVEAEAKRLAELEAQRVAEEVAAKAEAERRALDAERRLQESEARRFRETQEAEARLKAEQDLRRKAEAETERLAKEAERKAKEDAAALAKQKAEAEIKRKAEEASRQAERKAAAEKAAAERQASIEAAKAKALAAEPVAPTSPPLTFQNKFTAATAKELGAEVESIADVTRAAEKVFGKGHVPDAASWRRMWSVPDGYALEFKNFSEVSGGVFIELDIVHKGEKIGEMHRTFARVKNEVVVKHDYMSINTEHRGQGIGESLTRSAIYSYREMGVASIQTEAMMVGRYTWARFGFTWSAEEGAVIRQDFEHFLTGKVGAERAKVLSELALHNANAVASLEVNGQKLGKEFLLGRSLTVWDGHLDLKAGSEGLKIATKRLGLSFPKAAEAAAPKPALKSVVKPEPKVAPKPVVKAEPKPEPKSAPKPEAPKPAAPKPEPVKAPAPEPTKVAPPPPKGEPEKMEAGVHATKLTNRAGLDDETIARITGPIVSDPGMMRYLEQHPIGHLEFNTYLYGGAIGNYDPESKLLYVSTRAEHGATFGKERAFGKTDSLAFGAHDAEGSTQVTFVHELGHHIHTHDIGTAKQTLVDDLIRHHYDTAPASAFITQYSRTNAEEYWAENFAAYHLRKDDLLKYDPNAYKMVEEVLKLRGIK